MKVNELVVERAVIAFLFGLLLLVGQGWVGRVQKTQDDVEQLREKLVELQARYDARSHDCP